MILEVINGGFSYGRTKILDGVQMSVEEHDICAILGRNGIGKTTLLKCIMAMLPWQEGKAELDGEDIQRIPYRRLWKNIAYVPQAKRGSNISVRDMVVMGRNVHLGTFGKPKKEDYDIADEVLEKLYISKLAVKQCNSISGGELQLVLIARALAAKPRLLIMDEPESNLDYHNQLHVLQLIHSLSKEMACIINTHYPEHALRYANKALLLSESGDNNFGSVECVVTEENLKEAFRITAHIGRETIGDQTYPYIIPLHHS